MAVNITLPLPAGWASEVEILNEEDTEITHYQAYLPDDRAQKDKALIDIFVGVTPEGSSAEIEALNSYAEMFDDDDDDPLTVWPFMGKEAYGYEGLCEDESPMRFMCVETEPDLLAIITVAACNDAMLENAVTLLDTKLSIKA